jgi:hypothetical protein
MRAELGEFFDVKLDRWNFAGEIRYSIEQLKVLASETERKKAIATQLEGLQRSMNRDLEHIIKNYTGE